MQKRVLGIGTKEQHSNLDVLISFGALGALVITAQVNMHLKKKEKKKSDVILNPPNAE